MDQVLWVAGHLLLIFSFTIYFRVLYQAPETRQKYRIAFKSRFRWVIGAGIVLLAVGATINSSWKEGMATALIIPPYVQLLLWIMRKLFAAKNNKPLEDNP